LWGEQDYFMILNKVPLLNILKQKNIKRACDFFLFKILWGEQDFASQHPSELRSENTSNEEKRSSKLGVFLY
jgi:hypothetical protein